jgi:hypothetical protein
VGIFPSDHLVFPLEFSNNTGTTVLLKEPTLVLDGIDAPPDKNVNFFMVGEFKALSPSVLQDVNSHPPSFTKSILSTSDIPKILPSSSLTLTPSR